MTLPSTSPSWYRVAPLRPALVPHARLHRHCYRGEPWYVLHDPVAGRVHRFTPAASMFVARLDGSTTLGQLWAALANNGGETAPTQDEIIDVLARLHAADLLQCDIPPDAAELLERHNRQARPRLLAGLMTPLSIRLPLWDPDRPLRRLARWARPLLGPAGIILWLAIVLPAAILAAMHSSQLAGTLSDRVLAADNLALMALAYVVIKALHELGHGVVARGFGIEIHEVGIMLLAFFPVPYVEASGSAALPSKYHRAAIAAAGMAVELLIAALALFAWLTLAQGTVRALAFDVMTVAGLSTIIFNGNPLLRYDGYYVLSDLAELPNLGQRAGQYWSHLIHVNVFGVDDNGQPFPAQPAEKVWFLLYAPAAAAYRFFVLVSIAVMVANRFFIIGTVLALWATVNGAVLPLAKGLSQVFSSPRLHRKRRRVRMIVLGGAAAAALFVVAVPLPLHTLTEGVVWLPEDAHLRAGTDGFVTTLLAESGQPIALGDAVARLETPSLAADLARLNARVRELEAEFAASRFSDQVKARLVWLELSRQHEELNRQSDRAQRLVVKSGAEGTLVIPNSGDLPGRFLHEGDLIGYIIPPRARMLRVVVPQENIELVRETLVRVEARLPGRPDATFFGTVVREVPAADARLPSLVVGTAGGGRYAVDPRDDKRTQALNRLFQVDVGLSPDITPALFGGRMVVRFDHQWEPLAFQAYRRLRQLFMAKLHA
jgi:putative peptide zinc metalloprotease protein